jgi:hypothetical protein
MHDTKCDQIRRSIRTCLESGQCQSETTFLLRCAMRQVNRIDAIPSRNIGDDVGDFLVEQQLDRLVILLDICVEQVSHNIGLHRLVSECLDKSFLLYSVSEVMR